MQHDPQSAVFSSAAGRTASGRPADVSSDELWREAIFAARQAATAAAELREAIEASRDRANRRDR